MIKKEGCFLLTWPITTVNFCKAAANLCSPSNRSSFKRFWALEIQQQKIYHRNMSTLEAFILFHPVFNCDVGMDLAAHMCKTSPLTYASRTKPDKMAPVWTIRIFLRRKCRKSYRRACHTAPASSATGVSTGMWQCAVKWSWHSTKQFMKVVCQQHFCVCAQRGSGW